MEGLRVTTVVLLEVAQRPDFQALNALLACSIWEGEVSHRGWGKVGNLKLDVPVARVLGTGLSHISKTPETHSSGFGNSGVGNNWDSLNL